MTVGLTGGYATGKSFVASQLERLGCLVIYADKLGHQVLQPDGAAYAPVIRSFGSDVLDADGSINRKKLGGIVFASPERLAELNRYVHPAVFQLEHEMLGRFAVSHLRGIAVVEAAILIETGRYKTFDRLIVTTCSEELQISRAMARDNASEEQVQARMKMQMPASEKKAFADYIIDTGISPENTIHQVEDVFRELRSLA